jgi:predicted TIM-barrel fold metal-dependent hydrolase
MPQCSLAPLPFEIPERACDCHMHIVGPLERYPFQENRSLSPPEALWEDYQQTAATLGLQRCVIVQPSFFGSDNHCTLDSVARAKHGSAVAVVVVDPHVTQHELRELHQRGARAIRAQMLVAGGMSFDALETVADLIAPFGWHLEIYLDTQDLPELAPRLRRLPIQVVFDHMGQWLPGDRDNERGFEILLELLAEGRSWVKLSNPRFAPSTVRAKRLISANPNRVLWGSDWPHVSHPLPHPDDRQLLGSLTDWVPDETTLQLILQRNPQELYFDDV